MRPIDADAIKYTSYVNGNVTVSKETIDAMPTVEQKHGHFNCVEMKATIDLYHIYAEKFNNATIQDEVNWYADICAVLLNRIREMEKRLHNELE